MTILIASIIPTDLPDLTAQAARAWEAGAEAVEVRLDKFSGDLSAVAVHLIEATDRTWILTCRSKAEGGHFEGDADSRVARLTEAGEGTGAYVDFEFGDWEQRPALRADVLRASAVRSGHRLILSAHDFASRESLAGKTDLSALIGRMRGVHEASVAKIAYLASNICDSFTALDIMHENRDDVIAVAMGEEGLWTRILAKKFGAFGSFGSLDEDTTTAPGQLTIDQMVNLYRWAAINEDTKVFGVVGDPVAHSMSPLLHNRWFAEAGINAVYLPLKVDGTGDCFARFLDACHDRPWLDLAGLSVTIPHKASALKWAGDGADPKAKWIGAANTLNFTGGRVRAYNTDSYAAVSALVDALGCDRNDLAGVTVDVLGSGGAAQAVVHGLHECGCRMTIYGRSARKTQRLAQEYKAVAATWDDRKKRTGELLVNCTSIGMFSLTDATPMPNECLNGCRLVFDLIYNPLQTKLLKGAAGAGSTTLNGLDMFVCQAAMQFELWTGVAPEVEAAKIELRRAMGLS